jgi:hypothetical protein
MKNITKEMEKKFQGMTVAERIYEINMWLEYCEAVNLKDYKLVRDIYENVLLDKNSIETMLERIKSGEYKVTNFKL